MRDLEFIRQFRQFPGSPGNDVAARCSEPPFPTHGGQDDGSYTNSLKLARPAHALARPTYLHILIDRFPCKGWPDIMSERVLTAHAEVTFSIETNRNAEEILRYVNTRPTDSIQDNLREFV